MRNNSKIKLQNSRRRHNIYPNPCTWPFTLLTWYRPGADPGFQVRGTHLKKIASSGGRRENFWGISCEKSRFYAKKSYFFPIVGGGGAPGAPPWIRPCRHGNKSGGIVKILVALKISKKKCLDCFANIGYFYRKRDDQIITLEKIEDRECNKEWAIQRHEQHWKRARTKTNIIKAQHRKLKRWAAQIQQQQKNKKQKTKNKKKSGMNPGTHEW